jgi:hypothetical protein
MTAVGKGDDSGGALRLLVLADPRAIASTRIVPAVLRAGRDRPDVEVVGLVDTASDAHGLAWTARTLAARMVSLAFNRAGPRTAVEHRPLLPDYRPLARRHRIPLLAPRGAGVNDPNLVERIGEELRPDATLSVMVPQIFRAPLLAASRATVNYHDGLLPDYRGVDATAWSLYRGDARSGFVFHHVSPGLDEGPIVVHDSVPIPAAAGTVDVVRAKARLAATHVDGLIDRLLRGDGGRPQVGRARMHRRTDTIALQTVDDPASLTWAELQRRLRAFELLELTLAGLTWEVTGLRRVDGHARHPELAFTTADGVAAEPSRCAHLPVWAYRRYRHR